MAISSESDLLILKGQESLLERGFKAWCENTSAAIRKRIGLAPYDPLSPDVLAEHYGIQIWTPQDVPGLPQDTLDYLTSPQGNDWSAVTVQMDNIIVIVINPTHTPARRTSNIMHELAHVIKGHTPSMIYLGKGTTLREYDRKQETEANWLSGVLLLPRAGLVSAMSSKDSKSKIMDNYGVSERLYTFRVNMSGVKRQFGRH